MQQLGEAALAFCLFLVAGVAGLSLRARLSERHLNRDTQDFVRLVVSALVTFLASDDARGMTGHEYFVDAGWR